MYFAKIDRLPEFWGFLATFLSTGRGMPLYWKGAGALLEGGLRSTERRLLLAPVSARLGILSRNFKHRFFYVWSSCV